MKYSLHLIFVFRILFTVSKMRKDRTKILSRISNTKKRKLVKSQKKKISLEREDLLKLCSPNYDLIIVI